MRRVEFGTTGVSVSEMCLGTMTFGGRVDQQETDLIVGSAIDSGVDFFDSAAMYNDGLTEEVLGRALRGRREKVFLATKVHAGTDRRSIQESLAASLKRLQVDAVDLYLIHWPVPGMNIEDTMAGLNAVVEKGMTRFVGCCNFPAWLLAHSNRIASERGWPDLKCNQVGYNLIERGVEVEILPQALAEKIAIATYRPLCMGILAGKYRPWEPLPEGSRADDPRMIAWATRYGHELRRFIEFCEEREITPVTASLGWLRYSPAVSTPIVGISSLSQLDAAIASFEYELSPPDYSLLSSIFQATSPWEEGVQSYPGINYNFPRLRRQTDLLA